MYNGQNRCMGARHQLAWRRLCRILFVLLVLVNFAALQTASAVKIHAHHHGGPNDHCCPGCHGGHFPVLQTARGVQLASLSVAGWRKSPNEALFTSDANCTFNSSRAPPA